MSNFDKLNAEMSKLSKRLDAAEERRGLRADVRADAAWVEGDHPRAADGKFGSGGGSSSGAGYNKYEDDAKFVKFHNSLKASGENVSKEEAFKRYEANESENISVRSSRAMAPDKPAKDIKAQLGERLQHGQSKDMHYSPEYRKALKVYTSGGTPEKFKEVLSNLEGAYKRHAEKFPNHK